MNPHNSINFGQNLPANKAYIERISELSENLRQNNQRQLLLCQGSREWCLSLFPGITRIYDPLLLSNNTAEVEAVAFSKAENLLGQEFDCVIYDQFSGLNIDVLCMAVGLIRAGGILVIWRPEDLQQVDDPYGRWQDRQNQDFYFQQYLDSQTMQSEAVVPLYQHSLPEDIKPLPYSEMITIRQQATVEQAIVLDSLRQWVKDKKASVFLLTADRGRGKSFALGLFVAEFQQSLKIVITANSKAQLSVLLRNLGAGNERFRFMAPDDFIRRQARVNCLIIDEAAMLPNSMLQRCLELADKVILATTTGGYEGTGQGFLLKFMAQFDAHEYLHLKLNEPVRWGKSDLLEIFFAEALFLRSQNPAFPNKHQGVVIQEISRKQLSKDTELLKSVYGLLVSAHYRTRPSDLRQLMEDENQRIVIATAGKNVIGVLLLNREGGLAAELCNDIFLGKRRPQGHLFAQMITAQAGIRNFAENLGYRIQRITVADQYRRKGTGRLLIEKAQRMVEEDGLDYVCSSFALDSTTALFWKKMGFDLIHIGFASGKSTGRQTVAVIRSSRYEVSKSVQPLIDKLNKNLPLYLLSLCRNMLWQDVLVLLQMLQINYQLTRLEEDEIYAFTQGFRGVELSQAALQRLLISTLYLDLDLTLKQQRLLIEKVLLNKRWQELQAFSADIGRKQLTQDIRQCINICYEYYQSHRT